MLFRQALARLVLASQLSVCVCKISNNRPEVSLSRFNLPRYQILGSVEFIMPVKRGFSLRQMLTVEPVLFLYAFGLFMNVPVSQQYIYSRLSEAKGFPYHFQQKTGCQGKDLNDSMKKLEKEVSGMILRFIEDKLLYNDTFPILQFYWSTERVLAYHSTIFFLKFTLHILDYIEIH